MPPAPPAVTWILPVKNGMPYLPETLASIEAQTFRDWEILVWENGSTDGTVEELDRWIPARIPGRVIKGRPLPLGDSLRELVLASSSEYCARIDADDVNEPDRLARQVAYLDANPEVGAVGARYLRIDGDGELLPLQDYVPLKSTDIVHALLYINPISHPTMLLRRSVVLDAGNYRNPYPVAIEDYDLWLRIAARHRLANLEECLLKYRVHSGSVTQQALHADRLHRYMRECLATNGRALFGCDESEMLALANRSHPRPLTAIRAIARHLASRSDDPTYDPMKDRSYIVACKHLLGPNQVIARLALLLMDPGKAQVIGRRLKRLPNGRRPTSS